MPINQVHRIGIGDAIPKAYLPFAPGGFDPTNHEQALKIRPRMLEAMAKGDADVIFVKTHNAHTKAHGVPLIPTRLTRGAVYIMRHPLDVACSYARHYDTSPDDACEGLSRDDHIIVGGPGAVPQYLGDWSAHARSWTRQKDFPVLVLRYEDLLEDPEKGFATLLSHIGVGIDQGKLARAVRFSSFDEVKAQETREGFIEKSPTAERFFHSGGSGKWRDILSSETAERFIERHRQMMTRFGYL